MSLLEVSHVSINYESPGAEPVVAVRDVSFSLEAGEFVGLVGESGSGKSTLGFAIAGLSRPPARLIAGDVVFDGTNIAKLNADQIRRQRRGGFAMVLQSGMNALNPVRRVRQHFMDIFEAHGHVAPANREKTARELMDKVELPAETLDRYPGELSGGMRQRVSIALALSLQPRLMVFDEPTTALDVLVQHAVMRTIRDLQRSEGFTAMLISHDLGLVLESTARVMVMHEGEIIEDAASVDLLQHPATDYTRMLLSNYADPRAEVVQLPGLMVRGDTITTTTATAVPSRPRAGRIARETLLVDGVSKVFPPARRGEESVQAVDDVSFTLEPGASMALVGASGSGKSTIAKLITGVERPTDGDIRFGAIQVDKLRRGALRAYRQNVQMVFQDPYASLNPLSTVEYALTRPVVNAYHLSRLETRRRVLELLDLVGLTPVEQFAAKLPHQLSGGQRQRVVIARALACEPQVLIADEPVSMLDVSLRAGILALLEDLRVRLGMSMLYITHDLLSARVVTDHILVLHHGKVVESGATAEVLRFPEDDYTKALLEAIPQPQRRVAS